MHVGRAVSSYKSLKYQIAAALAGPSWSPGTPRLGDEKYKLDVSIFICTGL